MSRGICHKVTVGFFLPLLAPAIVLFSGSTAAVAAEGPSLLEFAQQRSERTFKEVPKQVLAFYYTWYGTPERHGRWVHWGNVDSANHEISASTNYPALGAYDSYDPEVIDQHITWAQQHGVDGFICTWWGQDKYDDKAFRKVLDEAAKKDFTVSVYWETAPGSGREQVDRAVEDLLYVIENYGSHPCFLKVNGRPVIFVYGRVMNEVATQQWPAIISEVERRSPNGCLLIADGYSAGNARLFDGVHTYNICGWVQGNEGDDLADLAGKNFTKSVQLAKDAGKISCLTIIPGYDDTKIRTPGIVAKRDGGETYKTLWNEAIEADPDWVLITSWNEWHEGSEIEPSWEDGDQYLDLTATYAERFKEVPYSQVPVGNGLVEIPSAMKSTLQKRFAKHPIAVLPDFENDVVFWLADAGIPLQELTWEEVVTADELNANNYPLLLYAGYEDYRQTVSEPQDVDEHLQRYLREGGMLLILPAGPFPFYYNEEREAVNAGRKLGLPIRSGVGDPARVPTGWETPPEELSFQFHVNTEVLSQLPNTTAFPESGDLRWRPVTGKDVGSGDHYVPLATLRDNTGRVWGDGAAYVEHRTGELAGGKLLYVWMGLPNVVDRNQLWFDLLRFAAAKADIALPQP